MDPKTKALLHTSGAVLASHDKAHAYTEFTAYPPAYSMNVSDNLLMSMPTQDKKFLIARLAEIIGKNVAYAVKEQILKAYEMDAKSAIALIHDTQKSFYAQDFYFTSPEQQDALWGTPVGPITTNTSWNDPKVDVFAEIKKSVSKLKVEGSQGGSFGGILDLNTKSLWDAKEFADAFFNHPSTGLKPKPKETKAEYNDFVKVYHDLIPGFAKMIQACPVNDDQYCRDYSGPFLQYTIIHLNDYHHWTRESVADWLETLDHDLTFKTPEEVAKTEAHHEMIKKMIGQPQVLTLEQAKALGIHPTKEVKNGNSD